GGASDSGIERGGIVIWPAVTLGPAQSALRSFQVDVGPTPIGSSGGFSDDMEAGASNWTPSHDAGTTDWLLTGTHPDSGASSWFAENVAVVSDQLLALASPYSVPSTGASLSFHHDYDTETGFDGGVVEISTDGVVWSDLGPHAIENPYNGSINTCCSNPIGGRPAFSGSSGGYIRSRFDLSAFAGSQIWIRFRMGTDNIVAATGWWIDDVELGVLVVNDAQVDAGGAARASARRETQVIPEPDPMILLISGILGLAALGRGRYRA
ncbi:MAG: immune inhibitor A, partial [Myxococcales bacterium]|nr:immune inhibitor A [Myxococcales bacterium]